MTGEFIGPAPGLYGELAEELRAEDSLPSCVSDRELFERMERGMSAEPVRELWRVAYVLLLARRAGPLALVAAEIVSRECPS